ncbi:MAG: hypothetical protein R6W75_04420 [Smithellaceae bacterium]
MTTEELKHFRDKLLQLRTEIQEVDEMSRESSRPVELDQSAVGRVSRVDAIQAQQMSLASARRRQAQLSALEGALRRIESGEYGACFVCGEDMDLRRLEADPTNTRCLACARRR